MTHSPLVSILIPAFNQNIIYIKECIDSALGQSYKNIEVIVSDNHSTNGTKELLSEYCDDRLKVIVPDTFISMNENFAFCADHALGDYISFLSSDDILLASAIESLVSIFSMESQVVFGCGNIFYGRQLPKNINSTKTLIRKNLIGNQVFFDKKARDFFFPWTMASTWMAGDLIRREAYVATGGLRRCDFQIGGDVWLTNRLLEQGGFLYIDEPMALFRSRAVGHKEVDPDRRLLDFLDIISMDQRGDIVLGKKSYVYKARQWIVLSYRLGAMKSPSNKSKLIANSIFTQCKRNDLLILLRLHRKIPLIFRCTSITLNIVVVCRDFLGSIKSNLNNKS